MSKSTRPTVFLSYSHQDEDWKDRVVGHLKVLDAELDVWDDRRIAKGDAWLPEIQSAMDRAAVALLLISKDFLTSGFIKGTEVPHLLTRRKDGLRVIPLFVRPCAWQAVEWLAKIQGGPKDAKPLSEHRKFRADKILAELALEIRGWLNDGREEPVREAPNGGAGIEPGVSTPGNATPTTPSPEGAEASARGANPGRAVALPASLQDLGKSGGGPPGVETPGFMPAPLRGLSPTLPLPGGRDRRGPHRRRRLPESQILLPEALGCLPELQVLLPEALGRLPEASGRLPEPFGSLPERLGRLPESQILLPEPSGRLPEPSGKLPEPSGRAPETLGLLPAALGRVPGRLG
ncbi:MAG: toll/interleukin-1 receptor domain-containing protein [Thermoanaerobaculia bacterium]